MYYLKCNQCGYLNELKTEYLSLCDRCGRKIANNYKDWKANNPQSSFDDYRITVCVSGEEIQKQKPKKKAGLSTITQVLIGLGLGLIIILPITYFIGLKAVKIFNNIQATGSMEDQNWEEIKFPTMGLTFESPVKLSTYQIPFPENIKNLLDTTLLYQYESINGLQIVVNYFRYKPHIAQLNLVGAADGSMMEFKKRDGIMDLQYNQKDTARFGLNSIEQKGDFKILNIPYIIEGYFFGKDLMLWQIILIYQKDNALQQEIAARIVKSIQINHQNL